MTNSKSTKRALLTSALAMLMCVAMLIGTTFAWFTDTASTAVNKIQAGNLDVKLEYLSNGEWVDAEGMTLNFKKASDASGTEVLWEPGCTYELPAIHVVNKGNLALKYEIKITGIKGDAKLNKAIEWTLNNAEIGSNIGELAAGAQSEALVIKGHMKEEAGNEYQGLSIDGIAITVYATQNTVEHDSYNNTYDANAFNALKSLYPVNASAEVTDDGAEIKADTVKVSVPKDAIQTGVDNISMTVTKSADVNSKFEISEAKSDVTVQQFNIDVTGLVANSENEITVKMFIGKGYTFTDNKVTVKHLNGDTVEEIDGTYDAEGFVTFKTKSFSPFAVATPNVDAVIGTGTNTTYYAGLTEAVAAGGEITLLRDVSLTETIVLNESRKNVTINGGNYKVECPGNGVFKITAGTLTINSGSYHDTKTTKHIWGAVNAYGTAVVNINGGTYTAAGGYAVYAAGEDAKVIISGGTFSGTEENAAIRVTDEATICVVDFNCYGSVEATGGKLNFGGGSITG